MEVLHVLSNSRSDTEMGKQKPLRSPTEGSFFLPSKHPDQVDCLQLGCRSKTELFKGHKNPWAQLLFVKKKKKKW